MIRYFIETLGIDPPIINGDQMPLHRNESSGQSTLNFKNNETFVKENCLLSRDHVTLFTQIAADTNVKLPPEFVFKGTGNRPSRLTPPAGKSWSRDVETTLFQRIQGLYNVVSTSFDHDVPVGKLSMTTKGSYRLDQLLETINHCEIDLICSVMQTS